MTQRHPQTATHPFTLVFKASLRPLSFSTYYISYVRRVVEGQCAEWGSVHPIPWGPHMSRPSKSASRMSSSSSLALPPGLATCRWGYTDPSLAGPTCIAIPMCIQHILFLRSWHCPLPLCTRAAGPGQAAMSEEVGTAKANRFIVWFKDGKGAVQRLHKRDKDPKDSADRRAAPGPP